MLCVVPCLHAGYCLLCPQAFMSLNGKARLDCLSLELRSTSHYSWPRQRFWLSPRHCIENNSGKCLHVRPWQLVRVPGQTRRVCVQGGRQSSGCTDERRAFKNPERDGKRLLWHLNGSVLTCVTAVLSISWWLSRMCFYVVFARPAGGGGDKYRRGQE